jgi:hypothetical protein
MNLPKELGVSSRWAKLLTELEAEDIQVEVDNVCNYLDTFPDIADAVPAIGRKTRQEFGPGAVLSLVVNRDPEIDDPYLKLRVSLPNFTPDILDRFDEISGSFDDELYDKKGYILVTTGPASLSDAVGTMDVLESGSI